MGIVHFLNVNEGDCHVIRHPSGNTTVIDVCNASSTEEKAVALGTEYVAKSLGVSGNFNQKASPTNPIRYLKDRGISSIFRYVQTHPDMDHMDGIQDLFDEFSPANFWDTDNVKELDGDFGKYNENDWKFYRKLRAGSDNNPKRLTLFDGDKNVHFNQSENGGGGDGLHILAPTPALLDSANQNCDWNDSSYVILYRTGNDKRVLFPGDAHDDTWTHLLENHANDIADVDLLIAPHHGRDSSMNFSFLDTVRPGLTLFGNAKSKHLAYDKWANRGLSYITNNQAGNIVIDSDKSDNLDVYVSCQKFAEVYANQNGKTTIWSQEHEAWTLLSI